MISSTIAPTTASTNPTGSFGPYQPTARPMKPPSSAPTIPRMIVTMKPPGSRPGIRNLATTPTIKPKTIHPRMPMAFLLLTTRKQPGCPPIFATISGLSAAPSLPGPSPPVVETRNNFHVERALRAPRSGRIMIAVRRSLVIAAALMALPVLVGASAAGAEERAPAATLTVLSAPVERAGAQGQPAAVASGADLAVGDRVMTGPEGRALITFLDGSTVTVEPASEVTVRQAEMDGREASRLRVLILVGTVWARVAGWLGGRATVTLESNAYSATAHDGLIGAQQDRAGTFVCWTRAGNLEVSGPTGVAVRLAPGQKVTIAPNAAPRT